MTASTRAPGWEMAGDYFKNCNCIASCPCDTEGVPYPHKGCEGAAGMHITEGHYGDVRLDGLHWAGIVAWPGALHEGNGRMQPLIDERADDQQRAALLTILSGQAGGTFFGILAEVCPTVYDPVFAPFEFQFDLEKRRARVVVPGYLEVESEPLTVPATGEEQRVVVEMPDGFEYKQMEVARNVRLKGSGPVAFEHARSHASLARVRHNNAGLVA